MKGKPMTQTEFILICLKSGPLTTLQASNAGITRLGARIKELREGKKPVAGVIKPMGPPPMGPPPEPKKAPAVSRRDILRFGKGETEKK